MHVTLTKWGSSVGVRLSSDILRKAGLHIGDKVEIEFREEFGVILRPVTWRSRVDVAAMIDQITPETLHDATEFQTNAMGSEAW